MNVANVSPLELIEILKAQIAKLEDENKLMEEENAQLKHFPLFVSF